MYRNKNELPVLVLPVQTLQSGLFLGVNNSVRTVLVEMLENMVVKLGLVTVTG